MLAQIVVIVATPAWNCTRYLTEMLIKTAPTFIGGWEGKEQIDICTLLLNVPSSLLIMDKNNYICDEKIRSYIDSRTAIVFTIICVVICLESLKLPRFFNYICNISALRKSRNIAVIRGRITRKSNENNRVLIDSISQIIFLCMDNDKKILAIEKLLVARLDKNNLN
jgi:hypothetical protein